MPIHLEIVTPERKTYADEVDSVVIPGLEGELGVLPNHAPLVTSLKPGELRISKGGEVTELAVGDGIVEVMQTSVAVVTDMAVTGEEIDEAAVQAALDRAQESLAGLTGDEEIAAVQAAIQKSLAQLHLKRKRRHV